MIKKFFGLFLSLIFGSLTFISAFILILLTQLPDFTSVKDYKPLMVSEVFDRKNEKIGEFFREKRLLATYDEIPKPLTYAFLASEDASFFEHQGVHFVSILRALIANIKAGRKVQGGSTITMQVARSLLLSREKTYVRKIKEIILAYRMEKNLSKEEILFLYLNQIYLGSGAYGIKVASDIYFRKPLKDLDLSEMALLAGLPQAPSRYSPIYYPREAKMRQLYVLHRMMEEGYISPTEARKYSQKPVKVYVRKDFQKLAPFYLEIIRQILVQFLGEEMVLDKGLKIHTGLDLQKQMMAQEEVQRGLRKLDKRQGFRGAIKKFQTKEDIEHFLVETRNKLIGEASPSRLLQPDGSLTYQNISFLEKIKGAEKKETDISHKNSTSHQDSSNQFEKNQPKITTPSLIPPLPHYIKPPQIIKGVVTQVDDKWGLVTIRFADTQGLIDIESMKWARKPDPYVRGEDAEISKPSEALEWGDVVKVKVIDKKFHSSRISKILLDQNEKRTKEKQQQQTWPEDLPLFKDYALLELEQEPLVEGALIAFDQKSSEIISMVGGYDFERSEFNRSLQATRQTGSSFKPIVYASALDKGLTPVTVLLDSPVIYEEIEEKNENLDLKQDDENEVQRKKRWKPKNYSNRFTGDVLLRNALIRSMNVPTVRVIRKVSIPWVMDYARRLGIFSSLNEDSTLSLGSSSITLYEMTKVLSQLGRLGYRIKPLLLHKVLSQENEILLQKVSLDERFKNEIQDLDLQFEKKREEYLTLLSQKEEIEQSSFKNSKENFTENTNSKTENEETLSSQKEFHEKRRTLSQSDSNPNSDQPNHEPSDSDKEETLSSLNSKLQQFPPFFFNNSNQLIRPSTAYIVTSLLTGAVEERRGTGRGARLLNRPVAGKTGTTDGNYDAWFIGYTTQVATGVWVGFDEEKTLGRGEAGGRVALPIWLGYMMQAHEGLPTQNFPVPEGIVFANIDNETGKLASTSSTDVVRQAFLEGSEPQEISDQKSLTNDDDDDKLFLKDDYTE